MLCKEKCKLLIKRLFKSPTEAEGKYIKQSGGRGQYGHVWLVLEPLDRGKGYQFEDKVVGGTIPREFIPGVEKGVVDALTYGNFGWISSS